MPIGLYWKNPCAPAPDQVHFSKSKSNPRADVSFMSGEEYNTHRCRHGWPEDWSDIHEFDCDPYDEGRECYGRGVYWKCPNSETPDAVHWSRKGSMYCRPKKLTCDVDFECPDEYMAHRAENGWPETWDMIREIEEWEQPKDYHQGVYWKCPNSDTPDAVHWSRRGTYESNPRRYGIDADFENPDEYMAHREAHGWPQDWSAIRDIDEWDAPEYDYSSSSDCSDWD